MALMSMFLLRSGRAAPLFQVSDLAGDAVDLGGLLSGRKALLLDFFFLACKPCVEAMPLLVELQARYRQRGLAVAALSHGDSASALQLWAQHSGLDLQLLQAATVNPIFLAYRVFAYPTLYLIGADACIAYRSASCQPQPLRQALDRLLG